MEKKLSSNIIYEVLKEKFPKKNDFGDSEFKEELDELLHFGIETKVQLTSLVLKHRSDVLAIDSEPLDEQHLKWYAEGNLIENLSDKIENEYWFALPGLLRITLELEFGDKYQQFSYKRDGIE
ncbi:MAG: hypothetical protein ACJASQ_002443 [Crocinitomicaceae bacterium]|jgi:hypothetical protein